MPNDRSAPSGLTSPDDYALPDIAATLEREFRARSETPLTLPDIPPHPLRVRLDPIVARATEALHSTCLPAALQAIPKVPANVARAVGVAALSLSLVGGGTAAAIHATAVPAASVAADVNGGRVPRQNEHLLMAMDAAQAPSTLPTGAVAALATQVTTAGAPGAPGAPVAADDIIVDPSTVTGQSMQVDGDVQIIYPIRDFHGESSGYGMRFHPILHVWKMHNGDDFPAGCGTPVYASAAGTVTHASYRGPSGNAVEIDHGDLNGDAAGSVFETHYFHLSAFGVKVGDHVEQGQFIGLVGTTGRSTGCHLHWEVLIDGQYVDPSSTVGGGTPVYGDKGQTWSEDHSAEDQRQKQDAQNDGDDGFVPTDPPAPQTPTETPATAPAPQAPATPETKTAKKNEAPETTVNPTEPAREPAPKETASEGTVAPEKDHQGTTKPVADPTDTPAPQEDAPETTDAPAPDTPTEAPAPQEPATDDAPETEPTDTPTEDPTDTPTEDPTEDPTTEPDTPDTDTSAADWKIDPDTGWPINPDTGKPVDPATLGDKNSE